MFQKCFTNLESIFYSKATSFKKRRKIVPNDIENFLNPIVLAVWFMDDGGKAQNTVRAFYINADITKGDVKSFNNSERILLQKALQNVFGLKINIQKAETNLKQIFDLSPICQGIINTTFIYLQLHMKNFIN